jgi:phosphoribosylglycinamide formyltransferase-1
MSLPIGVLVSGRGSNLQAILEACARPGFPAHVAVVISDRERAVALERARAAGVEALWINPKDFADREAFDRALVQELNARGAWLVCSAGFMRILAPAYVRAFAGRSSTSIPRCSGVPRPARPAAGARPRRQGRGRHRALHGRGHGQRPHRAAGGRPVEPGDTEETLSARILVQEHRLPEAIRLFAEGRLRIEGRRVIVTPGVGR